MKKIIPLLLSVSFFLIGCSIPSAPPVNSLAVSTQSSPGSQIEYYFTKANQRPEQALKSQINTAKSNLDIAIYSLTKKDIVDS